MKLLMICSSYTEICVCVSVCKDKNRSSNLIFFCCKKAVAVGQTDQFTGFVHI